MHRVCAPKLNTEELWGKGKSWLQTGVGLAEDTKRLAVTLSSALIVRHRDRRGDAAAAPFGCAADSGPPDFQDAIAM